MVLEGTGNFEVLLRNEKNDDDVEVVLSGRIYVVDKKTQLESKYGAFESLDRTVTKAEFYQALREIGYSLDGDFVALDALSSNKTGRYFMESGIDTSFPQLQSFFFRFHLDHPLER